MICSCFAAFLLVVLAIACFSLLTRLFQARRRSREEGEERRKRRRRRSTARCRRPGGVLPNVTSAIKAKAASPQQVFSPPISIPDSTDSGGLEQVSLVFMKTFELSNFSQTIRKAKSRLHLNRSFSVWLPKRMETNRVNRRPRH